MPVCNVNLALHITRVSWNFTRTPVKPRNIRTFVNIMINVGTLDVNGWSIACVHVKVGIENFYETCLPNTRGPIKNAAGVVEEPRKSYFYEPVGRGMNSSAHRFATETPVPPRATPGQHRSAKEERGMWT